MTGVRPDVRADELRELLLARGISGVPVVDEQGRPLGIVSKTDLLRAQQEEGDGIEVAGDRRGTGDRLEPSSHLQPQRYTSAGEIMTPFPFAVHERSTIGQAAALMAYEGVHRLPVISDDKRVVGILSSPDVLRWFGQRSGYILSPRAPNERS